MNRFAKASFGITITAAILLACLLCRADDAPHKGTRMENRFLFVIDTSSSMRSRTNGIEEAVAGLLKTDMRGEFRKGDTLGIWTYDEKIHADFPMQTWSPENKDAIASDVLRYLRHQHYENRAHLDKVLNAIGRVMEKSAKLTVILIHDGSEPIRGTEFDTDINELQKKYARQFRSSHLPMVTILASRLGQVFDYTINYPNSISVPHTALPVPPPETNAPPAAAIAVAPGPPTNSAPVAPTPPPRRIEIIMSGTNSVTRTIPQTDTMPDNPSSAPSNIVMAATPHPQPQPSGVIPASVVAELIVTNQPSAAAPEPAAVTAQPEPAPVVPSAPSRVLPAPAPLPAHAPAPVPPSEPVPPPASVALPGQVMTPAPVPVPSPAPAPFAVASAGQQAALFIIAFSLLTIAVVLVVFLVRRSRGNAPPSLISQSIDRTR
jgi:hypothetical protein